MPVWVQVLNSLAPAQLATSDAAGAESMLKSSFTLAKNFHDLSSQVAVSDSDIECSPYTHGHKYM